MKSATYVIKNKMGVHARPAADIAKLVGKHKSDVTLEVGSKKANAKSVLMVTTLGAKKGTEVTLSVSGEDEEEVFAQLDDMFQNGFYEE
ncbi:MAG: HPr family phosphocarrier protein [Lachnospiraceae bacterium]|jgi:phosphocarrier protein HPr|nr:HPr family phosphocarrier protein [Lachnospiraceae bacterium]